MWTHGRTDIYPVSFEAVPTTEFCRMEVSDWRDLTNREAGEQSAGSWKQGTTQACFASLIPHAWTAEYRRSRARNSVKRREGAWRRSVPSRSGWKRVLY